MMRWRKGMLSRFVITPVTLLGVMFIVCRQGDVTGRNIKMPSDVGFFHEKASLTQNVDLVSDAKGGAAHTVRSGDSVIVPTLNVDAPADPNDNSSYPANWSFVSLYLQAKNSVVELDGRRPLNDGGMSPVRPRGTGFFASRDGDIATVLHTVDDVQGLSVRTADGRSYPARVVERDPVHDLAVLRISSQAKPYFKPLTLGSSSNLVGGEELSTFSFPKTWHKLFYSPGFFQATGQLQNLQPKYKELLGDREDGWQDMLRIKSHGEKGTSGAPVLDNNGKVVGLVDLGDPGEDIMAVPVEALKKMIHS